MARVSERAQSSPMEVNQGEGTMVYVERDASGRILRVETTPFETMSDTLAWQSEELERWITAQEEVRRRLHDLKSTDHEIIRVLEDVVSLLVERDIIRYTDLPEMARIKLDERALARAEIEALRDTMKVKYA